jgi:3-dehydroquinate synthase
VGAGIRMKCLKVNLTNNPYLIVITNNFSDFLTYVQECSQKIIVITDSNIEKLYLNTFVNSISFGYADVLSYVVKAGEESKSLNIVQKIYQFLNENNVCRNDVIISFGGGVIGDLVGFVAATFMRGIRLIHVPTSLLAQNDSSIGGKTAVNFCKVKNIIGAFYQPKLVYINYNVLHTLSENEVKNGLVEILVHAIIKDESLFTYIEDNLENVLNLEPHILENLIYWNCSIKASVVEKDELDNGERAILNFGHTFGHAIESSYAYRYKHGECVALGILAACYISEELNFIDDSITARIKNILNRIHVLRNIQDCDKEKVFYFIKNDKKNVSGKMVFILPLEIGKVIKYEIEDFDIVERVLKRLMEDNS